MGSAPWCWIRAAAGIGVLVLGVGWTSGGVAGSDPVATIGRVAASPPDGVRFQGASLTVWSTARAVARAKDLARVARAALGQEDARAVSIRAGSLGGVRWATAAEGSRWSVVQWTPAARALGQSASLVVMVGERLAQPAGLSSATSELAHSLAPRGAIQVAACAQGSAPGNWAPLALARALAGRMGATVTEAVGGPAAADLFGRLPGVSAVTVAGRPINLEVRVTRTATGLVVDIASPFVAPAGCMAEGDGAQVA